MQPNAVVDTNVFVELFSIQDIFPELKLIAQAGLETSVGLEGRRERARGTILMAAYLHKSNATTISLTGEFSKVLSKGLADADAARGLYFNYSHILGLFVKPNIWSNWSISHTPEFEKVFDETADMEKWQAYLNANEPSKKEADRFLVETAKKFGIPMITNDGKNDLLRFAAEQGVTLLRPEEVWSGKIDPHKESLSFLRHFKSRRHRYQPEPPIARHKLDMSMDLAYGYLYRVLMGRKPPIEA